jgi:hypothetical protein
VIGVPRLATRIRTFCRTVRLAFRDDDSFVYPEDNRSMPDPVAVGTKGESHTLVAARVDNGLVWRNRPCDTV